jgi:hypothetical protein
MPASLVLNDGIATPVARTFLSVQPYMGAKAPARWFYRPAAATDRTMDVIVEIGYKRVGSVTHTPLKVQVPFTVTVNSVVERGLALFDSQSGGYRIPDNAPAATVSDLEAFVRNFQADTTIRNAIKNGTPIV